MTTALPDFSRHAELALPARVIAGVQAAAEALGVRTLIAGAFARDLHLRYAHGIDALRGTEDVDIGLAVPDWPTFMRLRQAMVDSGDFREHPGTLHRLRHTSDLPVDLLPFAGVEDGEHRIAWPPRGEFRMDVFGFSEALASAWPVCLPGKVTADVVSPAALALLKIVAWEARHYASPRKDAHDLALIARHYLDLGNDARLWNEFPHWADEDDFDLTRIAARLLGVDVGRLLDKAGRARIATILSVQTNRDVPGLLPQEMSPHDPARACILLTGILEGLDRR